MTPRDIRISDTIDLWCTNGVLIENVPTEWNDCGEWVSDPAWRDGREYYEYDSRLRFVRLGNLRLDRDAVVEMIGEPALIKIETERSEALTEGEN